MAHQESLHTVIYDVKPRNEVALSLRHVQLQEIHELVR